MGKPEAMFLIGPTGSGKTPLGAFLEERGLHGRRCVHFDFGEELRRIAGNRGRRQRTRLSAEAGPAKAEAEARPSPLFGRGEVAFIRKVLQEGALLKNEHFRIAERILAAFIGRQQPSAANGSRNAEAGMPLDRSAAGAPDCPLVILNGLPRHIGQAAEVERFVDIRAVIHLDCTPEVVLERIRANAGGDRSARTDDGLESVREKLAIFEKHTRPLLEHYAAHGAQIIDIEVAGDTMPEEVWEQLEGILHA